jgi:hypothetical protein
MTPLEERKIVLLRCTVEAVAGSGEDERIGPKKSSRSKCERCNKSRKIAFVSFPALDTVFFGRTDSNLWPFSALIKGKRHQF